MSALILPSCACPFTTPSISSFSIARQRPFLVNPYFYEYKSAPDLCYRPPWQNSNFSASLTTHAVAFQLPASSAQIPEGEENSNRNSPFSEIGGNHSKQRRSLFSNRNKNELSGNCAF